MAARLSSGATQVSRWRCEHHDATLSLPRRSRDPFRSRLFLLHLVVDRPRRRATAARRTGFRRQRTKPFPKPSHQETVLAGGLATRFSLKRPLETHLMAIAPS